MYSLGVVFYKMIFGDYPYKAKKKEDFIKLIKTNNPYMGHLKIDPIIKKLILDMMKYDPNERITWKELFQHPLFA